MFVYVWCEDHPHARSEYLGGLAIVPVDEGHLHQGMMELEVTKKKNKKKITPAPITLKREETGTPCDVTSQSEGAVGRICTAA